MVIYPGPGSIKKETDIDAAPSKSFIIEHYNDESFKPFFELSVAKRPEFEFYNLTSDPYCLEDLSGDAELK